jgi:hypothetical protein
MKAARIPVRPSETILSPSLKKNNITEIVHPTLYSVDVFQCLRFEIFTAVIMKNAVFWDVAAICSHLLTLVPRSRIFLP